MVYFNAKSIKQAKRIAKKRRYYVGSVHKVKKGKYSAARRF